MNFVEVEIRSTSVLRDGNFHLQVFTVGVLVGAVRSFNGQRVHALQDGGSFVQAAFSRLDEADAVLGVVFSLVRPLICVRIFSETARPAASSAALLMR